MFHIDIKNKLHRLVKLNLWVFKLEDIHDKYCYICVVYILIKCGVEENFVFLLAELNTFIVLNVIFVHNHISTLRELIS